jgi:hypothetical protein
LKRIARGLSIRRDFREPRLEAIGLSAEIDNSACSIESLRFGGLRR